MGLFFRKSKDFGFGKLNFSNSGIGLSTGIKGLRFGIDSKGRQYISGGKGVFRFREYIKSDNKKEINMIENNYKPTVFNSFTAKGLGHLLLFANTIIGSFVSLFVIMLFMVMSTAIIEKHIWWAIFLFITGLYSGYFVWQFIYLPKFVRVAKKAFVKYKNGNFSEAKSLLEQSKEQETNSNYYMGKYEFTNWVNDILYECYINLKEYDCAYILISNTKIISNRRSKFVGLLTRLERWQELVNFMQKEYTQEEKKQHPVFYKILAEAFLKLNQPEVAIDCLLQGPANSRKMNDEMCDFRYTLGKCYESIGDIDNAKKQYQKVYAYNSSYEDVAEKINLT